MNRTPRVASITRSAPGLIDGLRELDGKVIGLCAVTFVADIVLGVQVSTFSVYAQTAGTAVVAIGVMNTVSGFIQLGASLPFGALSDRTGRSGLYTGGVAIFSLAMLIMACSRSSEALWIGKILFGLGSIAVFQIGNAIVGDLTTPEQRPYAFGLLTTGMGLGYGLGPFLGGMLIDQFSHAVAYLFATAVGLGGTALSLKTFGGRQGLRGTPPGASSLLSGFRVIFGNPDLLLVTFASMMIGLTFAGTLSIFLPLYGKELALSQTTIGMMFAVRSGVSAAGRIPNSLLAQRIGSLPVMVWALVVDAVAMFAICGARNPAVIMAVLAIDGLAYGGFVVAGQTYVTNHTTAENRGSTGGVYAMASGFGGTVAPIFLSVVAETWGVSAVFATTGIVLSLGLLIFVGGNAWLRVRRGTSLSSSEVPEPELLSGFIRAGNTSRLGQDSS